MTSSLADPLLRVENLVRSFGGIKATDNLSLDVAPGELHAIIGPNGAGKTTLISQLTGQLMPNSGTVQFAGREIADGTTFPEWKPGAQWKPRRDETMKAAKGSGAR